jgi:hypothetical protein
MILKYYLPLEEFLTAWKLANSRMAHHPMRPCQIDSGVNLKRPVMDKEGKVA